MKYLALELKKSFDPYFSAPMEVWETFVAHGEIVSCAKDDVIKDYGTVEKYFYYIIQGSGGIMLYQGTNYVCVDICLAGSFFGDYLSFITQEATALEVICFEQSKLFRICRANFSKLGQTEIGLRLRQSAAESLFIHKQSQQIELLSKTPTERYLNLLDQEPQAILCIPNKHISSYLGITPQSLSRIRNRIKNLRG